MAKKMFPIVDGSRVSHCEGTSSNLFIESVIAEQCLRYFDLVEYLLVFGHSWDLLLKVPTAHASRAFKLSFSSIAIDSTMQKPSRVKHHYKTWAEEHRVKVVRFLPRPPISTIPKQTSHHTSPFLGQPCSALIPATRIGGGTHESFLAVGYTFAKPNFWKVPPKWLAPCFLTALHPLLASRVRVLNDVLAGGEEGWDSVVVGKGWWCSQGSGEGSYEEEDLKKFHLGIGM